MKRIWLASVALIIIAMTASSCANTVRGVGKDLRDTGQAVEDTVY